MLPALPKCYLKENVKENKDTTQRVFLHIHVFRHTVFQKRDAVTPGTFTMENMDSARHIEMKMILMSLFQFATLHRKKNLKCEAIIKRTTEIRYFHKSFTLSDKFLVGF